MAIILDSAVFVGPLYLYLGEKEEESHVDKVKPQWLLLCKKRCWSPIISLKYIMLNNFLMWYLWNF